MISCQLSALLGARRLSQAQLARVTGIHRNTIHKLYADDWASIRRDTLDRVCAALQVQIGELLIWHEEGCVTLAALAYLSILVAPVLFVR